jgi:t-SNARE complex subunit (syntaxin)
VTRRKNEVYRNAVQKMNYYNISDPYNTDSLEDAISIFETILDWQNSREYIEKCKQEIESRKVRKRDSIIETEKFIKSERKTTLVKAIIIAVICILIVFVIMLLKSTT